MTNGVTPVCRKVRRSIILHSLLVFVPAGLGAEVNDLAAGGLLHAGGGGHKSAADRVSLELTREFSLAGGPLGMQQLGDASGNRPDHVPKQGEQEDRKEKVEYCPDHEQGRLRAAP